MSTFDLNELLQLAVLFCPVVLQDISSMTVADLHGLLTWLRRRAREAAP